MKILIDRVKIANYRAIKNLEISLDRFTVLVGTNNSGKTTFLRALHLVFGEGRKIISKEDFHLENGKFADEIIIDVRIIPVNEKDERVNSFEEPWFPGVFVEEHISSDEIGQSIIFRTKIREDNHKNGGYAIDRIILKQWDNSDKYPDDSLKTEKRISLESIPLYFVDAQRDVLQDMRERSSFLGRLISKIQLDPEKVKKVEDLLADLNSEIIEGSEVLQYLSKKLCELRGVIGSSKTKVEITPIHKKIRDIGKGLNIHLREQETESFTLDYHGTGTRSWASILTLKAFISWNAQESQKENEAFHPALALEEPESHLHPNAQRHLISQLMQMEGQKIVSTHSPFIAATCPLSSIRHFYKINGTTKIGELDTNITNDEIKKLEREILNYRGELLFAKCIVLCEGSTEEQMLPIFAKEYWKKDAFELGICFTGAGSGTNYKSFIRFCRSLNIRWFIFSDGEDKITDNLNNHLKALGLPDIGQNDNIIILPNNQNIEQYLLGQNYIIEEIRNAIFEREKSVCINEEHLKAKREEIQNYDIKEIKKYLSRTKTSIATYVAESIVKSADETHRIPDAFRQLFETIDNELNNEQ
ncbi:MAG: AAA family ATPase [Planctomycetaceae bacterium]|jgi:putative ATP-dependent endonuclease of OLD family|nr:AAA family ATPase [Planctomycetaceae bacterium]